MRHVVLIALSSFLLVTAGCKSECRLLSEKLCDCTVTNTDKTSCLSRAATLESNNPPNADQEAACKALIDSCDCRLIDTASGKERCGQAVPGSDGGI